MNTIHLEDFRCFKGSQSVRLAPLTLLVGENSTGKTSFQALVRALWDAAYGGTTPDFKEAPYDLGSFDQIVHYRGGRAGHFSEFRAGFDALSKTTSQNTRIGRSSGRSHHFEVTFGRKGTAPEPTRTLYEHDDASLTGLVTAGRSREIRFQTSNGEWLQTEPAGGSRSLERGPSSIALSLIGPTLLDIGRAKPVADSPTPTTEDRERLTQLLMEFRSPISRARPLASSPLRSKPSRTYDRPRSAHAPQEELLPTYFSTAFFEDIQSWESLRDALETFGRKAGLFDEISVKPLGKGGSEPFQMQVRKFGRRTKGPLRDLVDVGYGISQVLPVITELLREKDTPMFLLQQPEVHLHPSAQAELGTLFCQIADWSRQLVVETHSDHLLDRVRMDVRDGSCRLRPDQVSILYFERDDLEVQIHSLRLDEEGNVLDAPPSYRRFFLEESRRSLKL